MTYAVLVFHENKRAKHLYNMLSSNDFIYFTNSINAIGAASPRRGPSL